MTFRVIRVAHKCTMRFIRSILLLLKDGASAIITSESFNLFVLPFSNRLTTVSNRFNFSIQVFSNIICRITSSITRVHAINGCTRVFQFSIRQCISKTFHFRLILFSRHFRGVACYGLLQIRTRDPTTFRARKGCLFGRSARTLGLFLTSARMFITLNLFLHLIRIRRDIIDNVYCNSKNFRFINSIINRVTLRLFRYLLFRSNTCRRPRKRDRCSRGGR